MSIAMFFISAGDELNSEPFFINDHRISNANINEDSSQLTLRNWVEEKMRAGTSGKELLDMIAYEVDLQNKGRGADPSSSNNKSRLTPEKMKLVAPAILSKILQSDALNRYV